MTNSGGLYGVLADLAKKTPDAQATVDLSFELRASFSQLLNRVDRLAGVWHGLGVVPGSRVLWLGQNSARVLEGILACARLGAIFCPVNWRQSEAELAFVLADVEPVVVLWQQQEIGERVESLRKKYANSGQHWIQHDGEDNRYEADLQSNTCELAPRVVDPGEAVLMLYTAAFGGQPNGALLSHRAIMSQSAIYADLRAIDYQARYLNVGPLFHVATLLESMASFQAGGTNIFIRRAEAQIICQAIEQECCNNAFLLPPVIEQIIAYSKEHSVKLTSLCVLPGAPEWNALITVDKSAWGNKPYGFGQTETFGYASYCLLAENGLGSMGKPSSAVEIVMLDERGSVLPTGEVGEIAVRGDTVMNEYWRRPQINAERRSGEWHRCNDLGRIEADGSLSFIGPKARMIRSGQENIYPAEVEKCLLRYSAIREAAVIGIPDLQWDQSVKAIVVLEAGVDCSEADVIEFCRQHIASYKKPKQVEFVAQLPKKGAALDYQALDRDYGGGGYPGGG